MSGTDQRSAGSHSWSTASNFRVRFDHDDVNALDTTNMNANVASVSTKVLANNVNGTTTSADRCHLKNDRSRVLVGCFCFKTSNIDVEERISTSARTNIAAQNFVGY